MGLPCKEGPSTCHAMLFLGTRESPATVRGHPWDEPEEKQKVVVEVEVEDERGVGAGTGYDKNNYFCPESKKMKGMSRSILLIIQ